jgi:predicted Zn-dependent protease
VTFTAFWCAGWLLLLLSNLAAMVRLGRIEAGSLAAIVILLGCGVPALFALWWTAAGRREVVTIGHGRLTIVRSAGAFRRTSGFDLRDLRNLHVVPALRPLAREMAAVRGFWLGGSGPIVFDCGRRRYRWGSAMGTAAAGKLAADIAGMFPAEATQPATAEPWRPHPVWLGLTAAAMLVPALTLPVRAAITDRSICFGEDPAPPPERPVDVRSLRPAPRTISLVPLDNYPPQRARALADHFRRQFDLRLRVESSLATLGRADDESRGQANASALLSLLERRYPGKRHVVIGLTDRDMFIPDFQWGYAFSYRRDHRVAVVSSARLDRGCLGLFAAAEARQLARVRKLVGKNIGVMYYRLPLSRDPRSLLYARVGGPQELDGMSEVF